MEKSKEKMRKVIVILLSVLLLSVLLLSVLLLSGCIFIPENLPTSMPASLTPIIDSSLSPENTESPEPRETITTAPTTTLTATDTRIPTETPTETSTETPTETPTELPTETSIPQITITPFPFTLQSGTPAYIKNFAHPSYGCDWLGVVGQIFDGNGKPLINYVVTITGKIEGKIVDFVGITGVPQADIYGPGGFEIQIADHVFASEKALYIQVSNLDGIPISDSFPFDTFSDCEKNLVVINFQTTE